MIYVAVGIGFLYFIKPLDSEDESFVLKINEKLYKISVTFSKEKQLWKSKITNVK